MKLRSKFLLSMAVVTTALTAASMFIVRRSVGLHARQEIVASFDHSTTSLRDFQARQEMDAHHSAELLAQVPQLKAMMTTRDPVTVQDASASLWNSAGADLMLLYDLSGKRLAVHNTGEPLPSAGFPSTPPQAERGFRWVMIGSRLYEVVTQPIESGGSGETLRLGNLVLGYEIGPQMVKQIASLANGEIAFRFHRHIVASTLGAQQSTELARADATQDNRQVDELTLAHERFLSRAISLSSSDDEAELIVLKSYDQATVFVQQMNRLFLIVGTVVILIGAAVVFLISHTFTQPLDELVEGVRALGKGDFSYPLRTSGKDEVAELTSSFDGMRLSLQESQQRLVTSARLEAVGQLAGGVAHDFNNLITVIKGYADLLTMQIAADNPLMKYADQISKAGDRAASLTRQLLAFSRKQVLEPQAVDLNLVINNLQKMLKVLVGERYEVAFVPGTKLARVLADPGQVEQVVLNLVVNARDAMPEGGKIEIRTNCFEIDQRGAAQQGVALGRYVQISVADTGCGMDEETRKRIFQPFFTTKEVGKGTGLGLSIVYGVAKQTGGFVDVESKVGAGSTFRVVLPQLESAETSRISHPVKQEVLRGTETVLVVEDEDGVRAMVRDTLQSRGYKVLEAHNGEEALGILQQHSGSIDLLLADVVLPKLGGLDLAIRLQQSERGPRVLLMSGYTDRINEIEDANLPLIRKPFTPETLVRSIQAQIAQVPQSLQVAPA